MIYLDNSATTKPNKDVLTSFIQTSETFFANPSSIHQFGGKSERLLMKAREQAAKLLSVDTEEVIFTSGGTEGNNLAIKGIALEHQNRGKHIITTTVEHPSVTDACSALEKLGFEITYLPVNENGVISLGDLRNAIRKDTILISIIHVNNELGSIQPIVEIGQIAKAHQKLYFHVDHVQGLSKVPLELAESGIDLCTVSGHKIHGLKGTGLLYVNKRVRLFPLMHGGNQEFGIRSGTENLAGAVSIVKALRLIKEAEKTDAAMLRTLHDYLRVELREMHGIVINTPEASAPHIMNFSVLGIKPEVIIHMLGEQEIYISTKSACSSKQADDSKVLTACGFDAARSASGLRVSMSYENTKAEIIVFIKALENAVAFLKGMVE